MTGEAYGDICIAGCKKDIENNMKAVRFYKTVLLYSRIGQKLRQLAAGYLVYRTEHIVKLNREITLLEIGKEISMGKIMTIQSNQTWEGMAEIFPDVVFSHAGGEELKMQIIAPWWNREGAEIPKYPLVIFVQGSAWTFPGVWYQIPQLSELARKGYVVATITHRNSMEGHPFPACLQDVKTAIRFLRKNAEEYGIAADRIGLWGTSSGANLSLLAAMTEGEERYKTEEYPEYSDKVNFVVACFPTTDLVEYMQDDSADLEIKDIFVALSGGKMDEEMGILKEMSPYRKVKESDSITYPPIFLAHGDADELIPHSQSMKLYEELEKKGADVTMVTVEGAPHEDAFWSGEMLSLIYDFIDCYK